MRTCVWCDTTLPESTYKGHRRREFCDNKCKQQHYLLHKQMKHDADMVAEPYWSAAYQVLVEHYKWLERMVQDRLLDLEEEHKHVDKLEEQVQYYQRRTEDIQVDYAARLRGLGISEEHIQEFNTYWETQLNRKTVFTD